MPLTVVRSSSPTHSLSEHGTRASDSDHSSWQEVSSPQSPYSMFSSRKNDVIHGGQFPTPNVITINFPSTEFLDVFYAYFIEEL